MPDHTVPDATNWRFDEIETSERGRALGLDGAGTPDELLNEILNRFARAALHGDVRFGRDCDTPDQRHHGRERAVLASRHELYERMRRAYPERWSGPTRNWLPIGTVVLNPEPAPLARQLS